MFIEPERIKYFEEVANSVFDDKFFDKHGNGFNSDIDFLSESKPIGGNLNENKKLKNFFIEVKPIENKKGGDTYMSFVPRLNKAKEEDKKEGGDTYMSFVPRLNKAKEEDKKEGGDTYMSFVPRLNKAKEEDEKKGSSLKKANYKNSKLYKINELIKKLKSIIDLKTHAEYQKLASYAIQLSEKENISVKNALYKILKLD